MAPGSAMTIGTPAPTFSPNAPSPRSAKASPGFIARTSSRSRATTKPRVSRTAARMASGEVPASRRVAWMARPSMEPDRPSDAAPSNPSPSIAKPWSSPAFSANRLSTKTSSRPDSR